MAFKHGKNSYFAIGTSGSPTVLSNISTYLNEVGFPQTAETAQTTTFGDGVTTYVLGLKDSTFSISGLWDASLDAILAPLVGNETPVAYEYGPVGNTSGSVKYSGAGGAGNPGVFVTSYEVSSPVGDVVSFSAELQVTDAVTRGTFA